MATRTRHPAARRNAAGPPTPQPPSPPASPSPRSPDPSPDDLRAFVRVARLGSFTRAAEQLQIPRATVSTAVQRLETRVGARLLQRTTRRVQLTTDGEDFLGRCERILDDLEELGTLFRQQGAQVSGRLRVEWPLAWAAGPLMARLPEFVARHPGLQVEVSSSDRRADVIADGLDCVIRVGAIVDTSLVCRPLGHLPLMNVASPDYVARHGLPASLDDLAVHWLVHYQPNPSDQSAVFEYVDPVTGVGHRLPMRHRIAVNNSAAYEAACIAGLGIVQMPVTSSQNGIRSGRLVEILPSYRAPAMPVNLLFPHRRQMPRRVRAFADWLLETGRFVLDRAPPDRPG